MRYASKGHVCTTKDRLRELLRMEGHTSFATADTNLIHVAFDPRRKEHTWAMWDDYILTTAKGLETEAIQHSPQKVSASAQDLITMVYESNEHMVEDGWATLCAIDELKSRQVLGEEAVGVANAYPRKLEKCVCRHKNDGVDDFVIYIHKWSIVAGGVYNVFIFRSLEKLETHLERHDSLHLLSE
jgi:hypothetical protein